MASDSLTQAHVFGLFHPTPEDAPPTLVVGLWLWRVSVVLVPFTFFVTGSLLASTGDEMRETATAMASNFWLVVGTLGFILLVATVLHLVGALLTFFATLLVLGAIPIGVLMSLSLGRTLSGASRSRAGAGATLAVGTLFGLVGGAFVGASLAAMTGFEGLAPLFTYGVFLVPLAAWIILILPEHRRYFDARHEAWYQQDYRKRRGGPARSPPAVAAPRPTHTVQSEEPAPPKTTSEPKPAGPTPEKGGKGTAWRVGKR